MPVQTMQYIAEHSMFKAALPLVCALLIGSISWIFMSIMDMDKALHRIAESEIPQIHSQLKKNGEKIEEMEKLITNLRIRYAELSKISPGHPSRHPNNFTEDIKLQQ
tara:strand:- start:622 stop:942 length:321 start_codon:yes stop_codon:yes gene_type:complete